MISEQKKLERFEEGGMKRGIVLILSLLFLPALSWGADELVLVKGKGVPVCEAHLKNLKTLSLNEMVCNRDESYPEANGITRPKWERWELKEHKELVRRIEKFLGVGNQFGKLKIIDDKADFEDYLSTVLKSSFIKTSMIDIGNNGKPERVLLYSNRPCDVLENIAWNVPYSRPLLVLNKSENLIDVKKTEPLMQNPFPRDIKAKAVNSGYQLYDIFIYKESIYFDKWDMRTWTLAVYKLSNDMVTDVCRYKYISK